MDNEPCSSPMNFITRYSMRPCLFCGTMLWMLYDFRGKIMNTVTNPQLVVVLEKLTDVNYKHIDGIENIKEVLRERIDECQKATEGKK